MMAREVEELLVVDDQNVQILLSGTVLLDNTGSLYIDVQIMLSTKQWKLLFGEQKHIQFT